MRKARNMPLAAPTQGVPLRTKVRYAPDWSRRNNGHHNRPPLVANDSLAHARQQRALPDDAVAHQLRWSDWIMDP